MRSRYRCDMQAGKFDSGKETAAFLIRVVVEQPANSRARSPRSESHWLLRPNNRSNSRLCPSRNVWKQHSGRRASCSTSPHCLNDCLALFIGPPCGRDTVTSHIASRPLRPLVKKFERESLKYSLHPRLSTHHLRHTTTRLPLSTTIRRSRVNNPFFLFVPTNFSAEPRNNATPRLLINSRSLQNFTPLAPSILFPTHCSLLSTPITFRQ